MDMVQAGNTGDQPPRPEESDVLFRRIFDNAAVGIARVGLDGRFLLVNDQLCRIIGYTREELLSRTFSDITHPEDLQVSWRAARELIEGKVQTCNFEKRYRSSTGQAVWTHITSSLVRDPSGSPAYFVTVFQDINARKAAEQALRDLNATLERRVAQRTAVLQQQADQLRRLTAQLSDAEQRERTRLATTLHDGLQQILVAAQMRLQSCRQAMPEAGQPALTKVRELLNESISVSRSLVAELSPPVLHNAGFKEAIEWLASWFGDKHNLNVRLRIQASVPEVPDQLKVVMFQIVRELLFNVVKHSGATKAELWLAGQDERLLVGIDDEGRGFDPEQATWGHKDGGFGLFNIRERIEALGGALEIDSTPGEGTRIRVRSPRIGRDATLVAEIPVPEEPPAPEPRGKAAGLAGRPIRILVAEDHEIVREGLVTLLAHNPAFEVVGEAADGEEAVAQARALDPDVVIMDVSMPRLNGLDATRQIKQDRPDTRIVALSMHEEQAVANSMRQAGASAYVLKDGPSDLLIKTIEESVHPKNGTAKQ